jgi:tRNA dimethylallyltransferase
MQSKQSTVILVAGPTAVGKTAMAIRLAQYFNTSIISADSRQCYKEMNIGVARPSPEELATVPHYFIASHSVHQRVDAAVFEQYALDTAEKLFQQNEVVVLCGGTGMYIKAFLKGLDAIPEVRETVQAEVRTTYAEKGMEWLQEAVAAEDPVFFSSGEIHNPQRMMRALEVVRSTGNSIRFYQNQKTTERPFQVIKVGLQLPREILNTRIHQRVDVMMEAGLLTEAESLLPYQHLNALQTVGYQELFDYYNGKLNLSQAVEQIKIHTRQYAKRQMTWFGRDKEMTWFAPDEWEKINAFVCNRTMI